MLKLPALVYNKAKAENGALLRSTGQKFRLLRAVKDLRHCTLPRYIILRFILGARDKHVLI